MGVECRDWDNTTIYNINWKLITKIGNWQNKGYKISNSSNKCWQKLVKDSIS